MKSQGLERLTDPRFSQLVRGASSYESMESEDGSHSCDHWLRPGFSQVTRDQPPRLSWLDGPTLEDGENACGHQHTGDSPRSPARISPELQSRQMRGPQGRVAPPHLQPHCQPHSKMPAGSQLHPRPHGSLSITPRGHPLLLYLLTRQSKCDSHRVVHHLCFICKDNVLF